MSLILNIDLNNDINKKALSRAIKKKWNKALVITANTLVIDLPNILVYGGKNVLFQPFTSTRLWKFLNNPIAWGELGFPDLKPLDNLLDALKQSIKVQLIKSNPSSLLINLVDMKLVASLTPHPAGGTGQLSAGLSWFVDWVINGIPVRNYKFSKLKRDKKKDRAISLSELARSFPIAGESAGIMTAGGMWEFPPVFRPAIDIWLESNVKPIRIFVFDLIKRSLKRV